MNLTSARHLVLCKASRAAFCNLTCMKRVIVFRAFYAPTWYSGYNSSMALSAFTFETGRYTCKHEWKYLKVQVYMPHIMTILI